MNVIDIEAWLRDDPVLLFRSQAEQGFDFVFRPFQ